MKPVTSPVSPVFIVGSARSGTSILVDGLFAAGYAGHREGHFLTLLRAFDRATDRQIQVHGQPNPKVLAGRVDWPAFKQDMFQLFKRHTEALHPVAPWLDKTGGPDMIEAIPVLRHIWPEARFIFAKRRAIENILSRLKKFPARDFESHCSDWARNMAAWRGMRDHLQGSGIEIDQQDIARTPAAVAMRLAEFLRLDSAAEARIAGKFTNTRPQQTEEGSATRVVELNALGWTPRQINDFRRLCSEEMERFNYSVGESYWADAEQKALNVAD